MIFANVPAIVAKSKKHGLKKSRLPAPRKFWARKPSAELDRAGDWLLENLSVVRGQAVSRANPR